MKEVNFDKEISKLRFTEIFFAVLGGLSIILYFIVSFYFPYDNIQYLYLVMGFAYLSCANSDYNAKMLLMRLKK